MIISDEQMTASHELFELIGRLGFHNDDKRLAGSRQESSTVR